MTTRKWARCPTCGASGEFELLGEQRWPPPVAAKLGLPEVVTLWSCPHCMTTVSEPDLLTVAEDEMAGNEQRPGEIFWSADWPGTRDEARLPQRSTQAGKDRRAARHFWPED